MNTSSPQGTRKYVFWFILCLLPLIFFALLELGVRLAGLGKEYPLFIPVENEPQYLQPNPDVIKRFFSRPELAPSVSPDTVYFLAEKPAGSLRIVVLGESSAAGFPYGRFGSPSGMLEQRLKPLYPEKHIEIINVAMAAINSYTIRDFTDEVLAIKPDIVLIYAGHNEYLGVMGVGSSLAARDSRWKTLSYIALRQSHLFQVLDSVIAGWRIGDQPKKEMNDRTLMATVAENKNIPMGSPVYQQGLRQFEDNMRDILTAYSEAKVPVVIGTLASNERDQVPFASEGSDDLELQKELKLANELLASGNSAQAEKELLRLVKTHPGAADVHFSLAKAYEALSKINLAQKHYVVAKDLDLLRFRAPESINDIIRQLAASSEVYLADVQQQLREKSPYQIIGFDMMLEHLHPTANGYFWLAESYYQVLVNNKLLPEHRFKLSSEQALIWRPLSDIDEITSRWSIERLTSDYPFTKEPKDFQMDVDNTPEKKIAEERYLGKVSWLESTKILFDYYQKQKNWQAAIIVVGQLSDALPMNADLALIAGNISMDLGLTQLALFYSERGLRAQPQNQELLMLKAYSFFLMERYVDSKRMLKKVLMINPEHSMAMQFINEPWAKEAEEYEKKLHKN